MSKELREALEELSEKWNDIIDAFTSPYWNVKKSMDVIQVLKDVIKDVDAALAAHPATPSDTPKGGQHDGDRFRNDCYRIANAIGLAKSAIGDCVDELPYVEIRGKLWDLVKMLYKIHDAVAMNSSASQKLQPEKPHPATAGRRVVEQTLPCGLLPSDWRGTTDTLSAAGVFREAWNVGLQALRAADCAGISEYDEETAKQIRNAINEMEEVRFPATVGAELRYCGKCNERRYFRDGQCEMCSQRIQKYPMPCGLCPGQIESAEDTEWHGLGNCVPICERCSGSGIEPSTPATAGPSEGEREKNETWGGLDFKGLCSRCGKPVILTPTETVWHSKDRKVWHEVCSYQDQIEQLVTENEQLRAALALNGDSTTRSAAGSGLPPGEEKCT